MAIDHWGPQNGYRGLQKGVERGPRLHTIAIQTTFAKVLDKYTVTYFYWVTVYI